MTSKDRVKTALRHREPDRVPVGEMGIDADTIEQVLGRPTFLRGHFRTTQAIWDGRRDEVVESMKVDQVELIRKLDLDIVPVMLVPSKHKEVKRPKEIAEGTYQDEHGNILQYSDASKWLITVKDADEHRRFRVEDFADDEIAEPDDSELELVRHVVKELGDTHYILARSGDGTFPLLGGMERGLMMWYEEPEIVRASIQRSARRVIAQTAVFAREGADAVMPANDYAGSTGPMVSPGLLRELALPAMRAQCEAAHAAGIHVLKHACGNNWAIMDLFVEAGYDAYQSIQASATMDIRRLKATYGDRIALWGGVQVESLVGGTPDDVRRDAEYALRYAAPGGGYIFGSSHTVATGSKYENFMAMLEVARAKGAYPISL